MSLSAADVEYLRRCVDLARQALEAGDEPFGSLLLDADGAVRFEDHNHVAGGDATRHPELAIALNDALPYDEPLGRGGFSSLDRPAA